MVIKKKKSRTTNFLWTTEKSQRTGTVGCLEIIVSCLVGDTEPCIGYCLPVYRSVLEITNYAPHKNAARQQHSHTPAESCQQQRCGKD